MLWQDVVADGVRGVMAGWRFRQAFGGRLLGTGWWCAILAIQ